MTTFNTQSLRRPPTPAEIHELEQRRKSGEFGPPATNTGAIVVLAVFLVIAMNMVTFAIQFVTVARAQNAAASNTMAPFAVGVFLMIAALVAVAVTTAVRAFRRRSTWVPLALFARDNGLNFRLRSADPGYPGALFQIGSSRAATAHLWSPTATLADVGGYQYTTGSGKNRSTHHWNFVCFRLPRPVPHIVLDSTSNGSGSLPIGLSRQQLVTLGEPFDSRYRLYAPEGYAADAFRLFPPDLMERLMAAPGWLDIEFVDSWMFLYTRSPLNLADPTTWQLIGYLQDTLITRIADVAATYNDDRATPRAFAEDGTRQQGFPGHPAIAPQGRRLRIGWTPGRVLVAVFVVGLAAFQIGGALLQMLMR